ATPGRLRTFCTKAKGSQYVSPALWWTVIRRFEEARPSTASSAPGSVSTAHTRKIESAIARVVKTVRRGWRRRFFQTRGGVVPACGQADGPERDLRPPAPLGARQAGQQQRQLDVLDRAQHRDQVVELENEAHVPRAPGREAVLVEPGEGLAGDHHLARIG